MASGGEHTPSKRTHPNAESTNQGALFSDLNWTFPNNLELNTHSKPNRKHKNKEKTRSKVPHEGSSPSPSSTVQCTGNALSFHPFPRSRFSTASWLKDQLGSVGGITKRNVQSEADEDTSDVDQSVKHRRNFNMPINQRHHGARFQKSHGSVGSDAAINVPVNQRHQSSRFQNTQEHARNDVADNDSNKSPKQDNTKKLTDSTMLVERLKQLHDLIAQVNSILKNLEKSDEPVAREYKTELVTMIKKLTEEEREHIYLLQQIMACDPNVNDLALTAESAKAKACFGHRDLRNEEDKSNKQNHFLEQVKESQEKLTALKEQQAILVSLQKQAEDKLAAFHAQLLNPSPDPGHGDIDWQYAASERSAHSGMLDECVVNGVDSEWENDIFQQNSKPPRSSANLQKMKNSAQENLHSSTWQEDSQASSLTSTENRKPIPLIQQEGENESYQNSKPMRHSTNSQKMKNSTQENVLSAGWQEEPQLLGQLSVESHKSMSQILQELSDNKNMADNLSGDESEMTDPGDSLTYVEWKRKKLKNKLSELREKQVQNDQLKRELSSHNEVAKVSAVKFGEGEESLSHPAPQDNQQFLSISVEQNKRKLEELQETILQLTGFMNGIAPGTNSEDESSVNKELDEAEFAAARNFPATQNIRHVIPMKRENIRREQSPGFPARRHYEAEGRANEDPDVPSVAPAAVSPIPNQNSWEDDPRLQDKIRKLKEAKEKLKKIQGIMNTVQEYKDAGRRIPVEYLQLLQSFEDDKGDYEASGVDENEVKDNESDSLNQSNENEAMCLDPKALDGDAAQAQIAPADNKRLDQVDMVLNHKRNLESLIHERERLLNIHEQFMQLKNSFPLLQQRNNDTVRSSGEGGNLKKKRPIRTTSLTTHSASDGALTIRQRQDNLLTRQNIATMESQNRNKTNALSVIGEGVKAKKENINNLSSKVTKHTVPNASVRSLSESVSQENNDVSSSFSAELNHSLSLRDELQHKVALDDLLSEDRSKQQSYQRNQDIQVRSCSSINSEPLEGSNSVFAPDNTVAATWGGSSTQENFEDETEDPIESLEEQDEEEDDDDENNNETSTADAEVPQSASISNQFSNLQYPHAIASTAVKHRDKSLQKGFRGSHFNQWHEKKNITPCVINRGQTAARSARVENFIPEDSILQTEDGIQAAASAPPDSALGSNLPSNFVQQLEQLNALCQSILQEQQSIPQNLQRNIFSSFPVSNTGRQPRPSGDMMHHYTQQLQLQQQLLLSLSQCYHALYIQQLEIQHLQRCVQCNSDADTTVHNPPTVNAATVNSEEFNFRPWYLSPWLNGGLNSMPHQQGQMPSMCVPPLLQPSQQSFNFNTTPPAAAATAPPCALVSGMQSVRSVPNAGNQEVRPNVETLNNQVPPRTRANNFLDNFRSCSRQNLLSASSNNIKSNESGRTQSVSQIRSVPPLASNTVSWNQRAPEYIPTLDTNTPTFHASDRTLERERPPANPELQELMTRTKKPNSSRLQTVAAGRIVPDMSRKSTSSVNIISPMVDHQSARSNPFHSINMDSLSSYSSNISRPSQPQQTPRASALGSSNPSAPPQTTEPVLVSIFSEVSKLVAHNSVPPDSLMELFQELQNFKSDGLHRVLSAVRELAQTERTDQPSTSSAAASSEFKNRTDLKEVDQRITESLEPTSDSSQGSSEVPDSQENEEPVAKKPAEDLASHWNSNTLPTATIPPFGKTPISKSSTGAVKKRSMGNRNIQPCPFSSSEPVDANNGHVAHASSSTSKDASEALVERIIHEVLSCLHDHVMDECCPSLRSKICCRIMEALKANSTSPLPCIFISNLKQTLNRVIDEYSGLKVSDCEADLLKSVADVLFRELAYQRSTFQRPYVDGEECAATSDISSQPDVLPQACKLSSEEQKRVTKGPTEMTRLDTNLNFPAVSSEVSVDLIPESCSSISVDDSSNSFQLSSGVPQIVSVHSAYGRENGYVVLNWSSATGNPEEDMGYECDPEAETEPEVEIGTEADLAEADQSPGQQSVISSASTGADSGHGDVAAAQSSHPVKQDNVLYEENGSGDFDVSSESGAQALLPDSLHEVEIDLDDIPTKLTPLSEEELQKQIKDEQEANAILNEVVEDFPLVGDGSAAKDPASFPPDSSEKR